MTGRAAKQQTLGELRRLQRLAGAVIMRPLGPGWRTQRRWTDNRDMRAVTGEFIKPNSRLTSFERIEIYNKQYWFRLYDTMYEDFPGLRAVLGAAKFNTLLKAYLTENPSRSYTLRNLASRLEQFIRSHRKLVSPRFDLAIDMVRFEWAQIVAFDGAARPPVSVDDLLGKAPNRIFLALQPYMAVLDLAYPLDDYTMQLKRDGLRGEASNAMEESPGKSRTRKRRARLPGRGRTFVVVHRHNNALYYKRLEPAGYRLLTELSGGASLQDALASTSRSRLDPEKIKDWFQTWTALGWFCKRNARGL
jgi:hypothetical protein